MRRNINIACGIWVLCIFNNCGVVVKSVFDTGLIRYMQCEVQVYPFHLPQKPVEICLVPFAV